MTPPLLTTREVAELLGISTEAVLRRWRAGDLPGFRLSTRVLRFREDEIVAWLERHRQGPPPLRLATLESLPPKSLDKVQDAL